MYFDFKKPTVEDVVLRTVNRLARLLEAEQFTGREIGRVVDDYGVVSITKTEDRSKRRTAHILILRKIH